MPLYSLTLTSPKDITPVSSTDVRPALKRLANELMRLSSGASLGTSTLKIRHTETAASGSVTVAAVQNADTVTIGGVALTATSHTARGTVTIVIANTDADDTVTINDVEFTAKAAEDTAAGEFNISGTATQAATSLKACIDASALASTLEVATAAGVVHLKYRTAGTAGNSGTIASSDADGLAVSGANFTGGAAVANDQFDFHAQFNNSTATALAAAINASTTTGLTGNVTASASSALVTITAVAPGIVGNAITLATGNGSRLAITGGAARLAGGAETLVSYTL